MLAVSTRTSSLEAAGAAGSKSSEASTRSKRPTKVREAQMVDLPQQRDVVGIEAVGAALQAGRLDRLLMGREQPAAGGESEKRQQRGTSPHAPSPRISGSQLADSRGARPIRRGSSATSTARR